MRARFHPQARTDLKEGKAFYSKRSPLAALAFGREIQAAISRIAQNPTRFPAGEHGTREFVLPWRFPYTIVYRIQKDDVIVIVAIAHQSREPDFWRDRT